MIKKRVPLSLWHLFLGNSLTFNNINWTINISYFAFDSPQFPINCFDNCTFDIRPPEEWIQLGLDFKDKRFYPLPGKAFLPLPAGAAKKKSPALSETVVDHLLTATPRLNRMYQWLLKER